MGRDRVVGNSGSLRAGWSGDRIPVEARFYVIVQTAPGAHTAFSKWVPGVIPGCEVDKVCR